MESIKRKLLSIKEEKGQLDFTDLLQLITPYNLSDDQVNSLINWINEEDLNVDISKPLDLTDQYFKEISVYPLLNNHQEKELAIKIKNGDSIAKDKFIKSNLRLVVNIAKNYYCPYLSLNDLIQEGNMGLVNAVNHYDPDNNVPFGKYAPFWIRKSILEAINRAQLVKIPQKIYQQINKIEETESLLQKQYQDKVTYKMIADYLNITEKRVEELLSYKVNILPIEKIRESDDLEISNDDPFVNERLAAMIDNFNVRDKEIITMYFGLDGNEEYTLVQIAEKFNLTKQRVHQIINEKLIQMRENYDK